MFIIKKKGRIILNWLRWLRFANIVLHISPNYKYPTIENTEKLICNCISIRKLSISIQIGVANIHKLD